MTIIHLAMLSERYEAHVFAGEARTQVIWALLLLIVACECLLLAWAMRADRKRRLAVLCIMQVLVVASWFAGELKLNYPSSLTRRLDRTPPYADVRISGDPALARLVEATRKRGAAPGRGTPADSLLRWQAASRKALRSALGHQGDAAAPPGPVPVVADTLLEGGIRRQLVTFPGFDGTPIPAYLFLHPAEHRAARPAILVIAGHGHGIVETAGLVPSLFHSMALELARSGYVVLAPEIRGFGYLGPHIGLDHCIVARNALAGGTHFAAAVSRDLARATTVLANVPGVDRARIGAAGMSLGGTLAILHAAADPRIAAVMAGAPQFDLFERHGLVRSWDRRAVPETPFCHLVPGGGYDPNRLALLYLIAPRPLLLTSGTREELGTLYGAAVDSVAWAYRSLGAAHSPRSVVEDGAHEFFLRPTREFFADAFRGVQR